MVPHFYMGPLPAFFYPAFQLMDYGVHSWDVRQGTGRAHGLSGEAADLLTPFMFVLWQYTTNPVTPDDACEIGIRITSGPNAGDTRVSLTEEGFSYAAGDDRRPDRPRVRPGQLRAHRVRPQQLRHDPRRPGRRRPLPEHLLQDLRHA